MLHLWSPLQRIENRDLFREVCTQLEDTARDLFFTTWVYGLVRRHLLGDIQLLRMICILPFFIIVTTRRLCAS
jgi:hypothetical protein